ncbi:XRE family transcriptional regulator [Streptomyces cinereoruber]|uniref:XRE family transcriptional regulator n=1 Tax=Streptomyces cinereoruber TaxID=67260 RepID=UPI00363BFB3E
MRTQLPRRRLVSTELLTLLMKRTGTGREVSIRGLAAIANVPRSTIGHLLTGVRMDIDSDSAHRIAAAIGVDDDILWITVQRAGLVALGSADGEQVTAA